MANNSRLYDEIGSFTAIPNWAIEMGETIGSDGLVLLMALRYHSGIGGDVFPSYNLIEKHTGLTRRRIAIAIRRLEELKIIERQKRFGASTIYRLKNLLTPTSSTPPVLMDNLEQTSVVQHIDSISTPPVPSLVQQVHTNKTHLTRFKKQESSEEKDDDNGLGRVCKSYQNNIGLIFSVILKEKIIEAFDRYGEEWLLKAIEAGALHHAKNWSYIDKVLQGYERNGFNSQRIVDDGYTE